MINKVILIGNVGADPEIRTLESGIKVARVRLATTERMYNRENQETREHTEWHTVTLWRNLADVADKYIRKGSQIYIEGRLRNREWTDQQGAKRYSMEIVADDLKLLGRKSDSPVQTGSSLSESNFSHNMGAQQSYAQAQSQAQSYGQPSQPVSPPAVNIDDDPDDLPF